MDAVERFEIQIDVSDRERMYNYVEGREYRRPEKGGWDLAVFREKSDLEQIGEDDENKQLLVEKMDQCFSDKRKLEKKKKDKKTDGRELYDPEDGGLPRRVVPIYTTGEIVRGTVHLRLSAPLKAVDLRVDLQGQAYVRTLIYNGTSAQEIINKEPFVKAETVLWERIPDSGSDVTDEMSLLSTDAPAKRGRVLPAGDHVFPVTFALPMACPQSTPPLIIHCVNQGHLAYRLKATISFGRLLAQGDIVTHKGLLVDRKVDIGDDPANQEPSVVEESLNTGTIAFWKSGSIAVRGTVPRRGMLRGRPVPVTIEVDNNSKGAISEISACVRLIGRAKLKNTEKCRFALNINVKSETVSEGPIADGMSPVYHWALPWDFGCSSVDGALLPVGDLDDSLALDVNYEVRVKLKRKGAHRNLELSIPIYVGNVDSSDSAVGGAGGFESKVAKVDTFESKA